MGWYGEIMHVIDNTKLQNAKERILTDMSESNKYSQSTAYSYYSSHSFD